MARKLYEITDYAEHYKPTNTKGEDLKYARFVKMPVKPRGKGLKALLKKPRGLEIFGVWCLLLQAATETERAEHRGKLLNHRDEPASVEEIAESISMEGKQSFIDAALSTLCAMGWITVRIDSVQGTEEVRSDYGEPTEAVRIESDKSSPKCSEVKCSEVKGSESARAGEFENEFWPNVPNKLGKGKAREAYIKARKKASKDDILAGLPKYRAYEDGRKTQKDYRPLHPATWLNQERWTDELGKPPPDDAAARADRFDREYEEALNDG
jgi:hypothetical protein